jgi:hypothetical protein
VHDAGDGILGFQPVQVEQAEQRFGTDNDREITFELRQRGGIGGAESPGQGGERLVD